MFNKIINQNILLYFVAAVIPLLSISIFLADLILSILSIFFLIFLMKYNPKFFIKNNFFILFLLFYILSIISSLFSNDIFFSLKSSLPLIRVIIFIFLISYLLENKSETVDIFYNFIKYSFLILVIYGFVSYYHDYRELFSADKLELINIRLELPFSDEAKLGSYIVRLYGLFLALYLIKKKRNKFENFFFFFLSLGASTIVLLSGERTSLFFMMLFISGCLVLLNIDLKKKLIFTIPIIIISSLFLLSNTNLSNRIFFDQNNELDFSSNNRIIFTAQHTAHYKVGLNMFFDKPLIGAGPKMFRKLCHNENYAEIVVRKDGYKVNGCSSHPHNTYIQLMAETGIIVTLIFCLGFFHILLNFSKHLLYMISKKGKKLDNYQVIINLSAFIIFWPFSPSGNIFNNWMLIIYSLAISMYVHEYFKYKKI